MAKLDFLGDEIAYTKLGKVFSFLGRTDVLVGTAVMTTLFSIASLEKTAPSESFVAFARSLAAMMATSMTHRFLYDTAMTMSIFKEADLKDKCINTQPETNQVSDISAYGVPAIHAAAFSRSTVVLAGLIAAGVFLKDIQVAKPLIDLLANEAPFAIVLSRSIPSLIRWNKVAAGEWHIEDKGPPPKPQPERSLLSRVGLAVPRKVATLG